jgi:hypothetical protein
MVPKTLDFVRSAEVAQRKNDEKYIKNRLFYVGFLLPNTLYL